VDDLGLILHGEWLCISRQLAVGVLLAPLPSFVEDDIAGDDDALIDWVIAAISFGPGLIADEDPLLAPVVELLQVRSRHRDVRDTAECSEVVDGGDLAVLGFVRCLAVECARRSSVEDVDCRRHSLTPEVARQPLCFEHALRHGDHTLIVPLHHPVLLRRVRGGELACDATLGVIPAELHRRELTSAICPQHLQL
jgi:hypothetical protein